MAIDHISAVTFAVRDMSRAVAFYEKLGFSVIHGGKQAPFSSLRFGQAFVNLTQTSGHERRWWGRVIFRVDDVDAYHRSLIGVGLHPEPPRDAPWGERFFHLTDPDGHELSFAQLLTPNEPSAPA